MKDLYFALGLPLHSLQGLRSCLWIQPREVRRGLELHKPEMLSMDEPGELGPVQHL